MVLLKGDEMVELTTGNIFDADVEALVNTVNVVGVMGKGIALQFRQAFPDNYELYRKACGRNEVVPGKMFVVPTNRFNNPKYIINFPTKRHWRGSSKIEDIKSGLDDLVDVIRRMDIRSIAIPPLGCGNGGLDWNDVQPKIVAAMAEVPNVKVAIFGPGGTPAVEDMRVATKPPRIQTWAALIALMLEYGIPGYRLTLLEIQKLAYLLQVAGQPLKLIFVKEKYGPYAEALNFVLQRMEGHYIRGYGDRNKEASVRVLPEAQLAASTVAADDNATMDRINRVSELIEGFESPHGMELLTTVHWIMAEVPQARTSSHVAIERVHAWNTRKAKIFPLHHIQAAYDRLVEKGWIDLDQSSSVPS